MHATDRDERLAHAARSTRDAATGTTSCSTLFGVDRVVLPEVVPSSRHRGRRRRCSARACRSRHRRRPAGGALRAGVLRGPARRRRRTARARFVLVHAGDDASAPPHGLLKTAAASRRAPPQFAVEGAVLVGGAALQWLRDGLGLLGDAAESEALARSVASTEGVVFVPALTGLGSPWWDPDARGLICRDHAGHDARAPRAGGARGDRAPGRRRRRCAAARGSASCAPTAARAANGFLMQFQADLLGTAGRGRGRARDDGARCSGARRRPGRPGRRRRRLRAPNRAGRGRRAAPGLGAVPCGERNPKGRLNENFQAALRCQVHP